MDDEFSFFLPGFGELDHEQFINLFYSLIVGYPNSILNYDESLEFKRSKLDELIKYFEEREEFEKCLNVKKIKDMLDVNK